MANNRTDTLNIEITADASKAKKAISDVTRGMETLRSVVKSMGQGSGGMKEIAKDAETAGKSIEQVAKKSEKVSAAVDTAGKKAGESLKKEAEELKFSIDAVRKRIQSEKWIPDDKRAKWLQMANAGTGNAKDPAQTLRIRAQMLSEILDEQKRLAEMTDEEKAAKKRVLEQDREKLRLYKEANALMREFMPASAFPVGGGTYRSGNEWYNAKDFLPGGSRYEEAMARRNAPPVETPVQEPTQAAETMEQVREAGEQLRETLEATGTSAMSFRERFGGVASVISKVIPVALGLLNAGVRVQKFFMNFTIGAFSESLRQAARITKALAGHLANLAKRLISMPFKAMGNHAKSSVGGMSDALRQGARFVTRYVLGFRSLFYLARRLRGAIGDAFTNLSQYSSETNANLSLLSSRLEQAKNSLATAFDPILTIVTPILDHFIQLLIGAMNVVGQFFATLSGASTFKKATFNMTDFAASADKSAASSGKAAEAADKLKKSLMGFDKINKLDDPNESSSGSGGGGGAGGGGLSGADMFTTEDVETGISNFAQMVKDAWKDSDFTDVGNLIGEKIASALTSIPWDKLKEKASDFGKSFGTFFNGLMESEITDDKGNKITLGDSIGTAIAEALNTGIEFLDSLTDTIHFDSIGKFMADGMNKLTITVKWTKIAKTLAKAANGVFKLAATWSGKFKFERLGKEIGKAVKKLFNKFDFKQLETACKNFGTGLAKFLKGFFKSKPLTAVGNAIGDALKAVLVGANSFIKNLPVSQIGTDLANAMNKVLGKRTLWVNLANLIANTANSVFKLASTWSNKFSFSQLGDTIRTVITTSLNRLNWKDAETATANIATGIATALNNVMTEDTFKAVGTAIGSGINLAMTGIHNFVSGVEWDNWGKNLGNGLNMFFKTVNWTELGITFDDTVKGLLSGVASTIETIDFETLGNDLVVALSNVNWGELFKKAIKLIEVAAEALTEFVAGLLKGLQKAIEDWVEANFPKVIADIILSRETGTGGTNNRPNGSDSSMGWTPDENPNTGGSSGRGMNPPDSTTPTYDHPEATTALAYDEQQPLTTRTIRLFAEKDPSYVNNVDNDYDTTNDKNLTATADGEVTNKWGPLFGDPTSIWQMLKGKKVVATADGATTPNYDSKIQGTNNSTGYLSLSPTKDVKVTADAETTSNYDSKIIGGTNDRKDGYVSLPETRTVKVTADAGTTPEYDSTIKGTDKANDGSYNGTQDKKVTLTADANLTDYYKTTIKNPNDPKAGLAGLLGKQAVSVTVDAKKTDKYKEIITGEKYKGKKGKKIDKVGLLEIPAEKTATVKATATGLKDISNVSSTIANIPKTKEVLVKIKGGITSSGRTALKAMVDIEEGATQTAYKRSQNIPTTEALGGAFFGGIWHRISQFAAGGVPGHGTVFVAGERGAETVGHINGRTEVLNQSQMASVMYDAVLRGMLQAMSVAGNGTDVHIHLDSDARKMFRVIQTEANNYTNATGRPAFNM